MPSAAALTAACSLSAVQLLAAAPLSEMPLPEVPELLPELLSLGSAQALRWVCSRRAANSRCFELAERTTAASHLPRHLRSESAAAERAISPAASPCASSGAWHWKETCDHTLSISLASATVQRPDFGGSGTLLRRAEFGSSITECHCSCLTPMSQEAASPKLQA